MPREHRSSTVPAETSRFASPRWGERLRSHIEGNIEKIPKARGRSILKLEDIVGKTGAAEIEAAGTLRFHFVGDTGMGDDTPQSMVADAMSEDYQGVPPSQAPAFFLHLGDVIYYANNPKGYRKQFYVPYRHYPGKIIAIPGNHDAETFEDDDAESLAAFQANFCQENPIVPDSAGSTYRQMVPQPGVYFRLIAPWVDVVALYSNAAENPGFITGNEAGDVQEKWLLATLRDIANERQAGPRKALIFVAHHPPYSQGGHSGSLEMLEQIDRVCRSADVWPDAFLGAHSHSYQRHSRYLPIGGVERRIPYIVAGCGGKGDKKVDYADGQRSGDHSYDYAYRGYGYGLAEVSPAGIRLSFQGVEADAQHEWSQHSKSEVDAVWVGLP